jgi:hypothetical protein
LQILYTFVFRAEIATIFGPNVVAISVISARNTKVYKIRMAIFSAFYNISQPNIAILLILVCRSFREYTFLARSKIIMGIVCSTTSKMQVKLRHFERRPFMFYLYFSSSLSPRNAQLSGVIAPTYAGTDRLYVIADNHCHWSFIKTSYDHY